MRNSLEIFRRDVVDTVLTFLWKQWSSLGVMAATSPTRPRVMDPEPLLLLTLETARQDPRMFDEVLDWLITNGRWINVVRLSSLHEQDKICPPEVLGAVAATLASHDKTPKWRALAKMCRPKETRTPEPFFFKYGEPLFLSGSETDPTFLDYGLLRQPMSTRGMSAPLLPSSGAGWTEANFMFKSRALFGVNIRADIFSFLALQGAANPTRIARELGYSQRRVQDALTEMTFADVFTTHSNGKATEYFVDSASVLRFLGATETDVSWFDWRALARALTTIWRGVFGLRKNGLTPYILESEQERLMRDVKNDLVSAAPRVRPAQFLEKPESNKSRGLIPQLKHTLPSSAGYAWKRYFHPRDGDVSYEDGGYPLIPDSGHEWPVPINSDVCEFRSVAHIPCLVLLGDPGMGKTHALRDAVESARASLVESGGKAMFLDLKAYGCEERLVRDLFDCDTFQGWLKGEYDLHLFLDSLDEALLHQSVVANLLAQKLAELRSVDRLFIRIACRTAEWPPILESSLRSKWGDAGLRILELLPLTRRDVREAADANQINFEDFQREIDLRGAVPLAFKPVTLRFLLQSYRHSGQLAASQKALYEQGCKLLCAEMGEGRIGARLAGRLTAEQRMDIAARIAAVTVFCNRNAIWIETPSAPTDSSEVTLDELCSFPASDPNMEITREGVMEALATGLFSSRGPGRLGWAHQTYAEFLAAWHLHRCGLATKRMLSLLVHPGDPDRRLVPQLHETAAWLAGVNRDVFRELIRSDPEVLLRSAVIGASPEDQHRLVESILAHAQEGNILDPDWTIERHYTRFAHPDNPAHSRRLAEQLRPVILDRTRHDLARYEAIRIADACKLTSLAAELTLVALDSTENHSIRGAAASFVANHGEGQIQRRLKPLLHLSPEEDPNDDLKGCAMRALWPGGMTAEELFAALGAPRGGGQYSNFIDKLPARLRPADLITAQAWVRNQKPRHQLDYSFRNLLEGILEQSVRNLEFPGLLGELAITLLVRLKKHDELVDRDSTGWRSTLTQDPSLRRRIVDVMVTQSTDPKNDAFSIACSRLPLVREDDIHWLGERFEAESDSKIRMTIAHLIRWAFRLTADAVDAVVCLSEVHPLIRDLFARELTPVKLSSPQASELRKEWLEYRSFRAQAADIESPPPINPPPAKRVSILLDRLEASADLDAWWRLLMEMSLEPTSTAYDHDDVIDVTKLPGWKAADCSTQARIIDAAARYLDGRAASAEEWFEKSNIWHRPSVAGFKALHLLQKEAPIKFAGLARDVWAKWMPVVVDQVETSPEEAGPILRKAYEVAPEDAIDWLGRLIERAGVSTGIEVLGDLWDERIKGLLLAKAGVSTQHPPLLGSMLKVLLTHGAPEGREVAASLIRSLSTNAESRPAAVASATALLGCGTDAWAIVWPVMLKDTGFGRALVEELADEYFRNAVPVAQLTADQVLDLYLWTLGQFPTAEDPDENGAHFVTDRERIGVFRDLLLAHLRDRGTPEACQALQQLVRQFPGSQHLKWILAQARTAMRQKTWQPPRPQELLALVENSDCRLVRDGGELLDVVVESIEQLERQLQGETPEAEFLWDRLPGGKGYRPKDENALANYVKKHLEQLKQRGVIVSREVEIRRGEETDIHIDAVVGDAVAGYEKASVIIEVKGSWNPELVEAIETQLTMRYIRNNSCQHGIYLVGWFNSAKWDKADYRQKASGKFEKGTLGGILDQKAAALSGRGLRIVAKVIDVSLR